MSTPKFVNTKMEIVKEIGTETGGIVIIYLVTPESILKEFYIATFDDRFMEVVWGLGDTPEEALKDAEMKWDRMKDEDEQDSSDNPFTEALKKLTEEKEGKKLTKEQLSEMCKKIEKTAKSENGEETVICHFTEHNRVWVDAKDLDWLADDLEDSTAKKLRDIMKYSTDFWGGFYYYDFATEG